jgi:hypothetical protein
LLGIRDNGWSDGLNTLQMNVSTRAGHHAEVIYQGANSAPAEVKKADHRVAFRRMQAKGTG